MKIDLEALKKSSEELDRDDKNYSLFFDSLTQDLLRYYDYKNENLEKMTFMEVLDDMVDQYRSDLNMLLVDYEVR
jgi:hypothetical protein